MLLFYLYTSLLTQLLVIFMTQQLQTYKNKAPILADNAYVHESAVLVGDIHLDTDASIWPLVAARGDVNFIRIGKRTNIQDGAVLHVTRTSINNANGYPLIVGNDVTIGHKAVLHGCTIKNRVLIGMGAIVLDGAVIEDDVLVGAGSVIPPNKVLESGNLYLGNPAKKVRSLTTDEIAFLKLSADNYVKLKNEYCENHNVE